MSGMRMRKPFHYQTNLLVARVGAHFEPFEHPSHPRTPGSDDSNQFWWRVSARIRHRIRVQNDWAADRYVLPRTKLTSLSEILLPTNVNTIVNLTLAIAAGKPPCNPWWYPNPNPNSKPNPMSWTCHRTTIKLSHFKRVHRRKCKSRTVGKPKINRINILNPFDLHIRVLLEKSFLAKLYGTC